MAIPAALLGAAKGLAGSQFVQGVAGSLFGSHLQGKYGAASAKDQMAFQLYMDNTKFQRAAKDLESAGLNRILALGNPGGAPSGARSTIDRINPITEGLAASSAKQAIKQSQSLEELNKAQKNLVDQQTKKAGAEASKANVEKALYEAVEPAVEEAVDKAKQAFSHSAKAVREAPEKIRGAIKSHKTYKHIGDEYGGW